MINQKKLTNSQWYLVAIIFIAIFVGIFVTNSYQKTIIEIDNFTLETVSISPQEAIPVKLHTQKQKPARQVAKGIYLTAYSAGSKKKIDSIIDLINKTELNAVVIDIKDYTGRVLYDSKVHLVQELKLEDDRIGDVRALIERLHENNIYVIARQTVFQDPTLADRKSEWAVRTLKNNIWYDNKGLSWVDPTRKEVWEYNVEIAREAIRLGFDEINFDYVRFPSDGNLKDIKYFDNEKEKHLVMADFYAYLSDKLSNEPAFISLDLFGFVMERDDGLFIGQRLVDSVNEVDYISPMMYPSHYPSGHLGLDNPAAHPGAVIENGMKKGSEKFVDARAEVRPWLQAFNLGAVYDANKIRAQIDMVEKYPNAGWLLWNASNRYSNAGLKPNEEIEVD
jgi:hypothetical protein